MPRRRLEGKLAAEAEIVRIKALKDLSRKANPKSIQALFQRFSDPSPNVRNFAARALASVCEAHPEASENVINQAEDVARNAGLASRIAAIQLLGQLESESSVELMLEIMVESGYDLQYAAVRALHYEASPRILGALGSVVHVKDYVTRRAAVLSAKDVIERVPPAQWTEVLTEHLHLLIGIHLDISAVSDILTTVLDNAANEALPAPRGYTEFDLVKLRRMLEQVEYSRYMYDSLWKITFPAYHPLEEGLQSPTGVQ